jgi:hypothetical protein
MQDYEMSQSRKHSPNNHLCEDLKPNMAPELFHLSGRCTLQGCGSECRRVRPSYENGSVFSEATHGKNSEAGELNSPQDKASPETDITLLVCQLQH